MKVLIVNDEREDTQGLLEKIRWDRLNLEVETAGSKHQAVRQFMSEPIDILVSDTEMPDGSGIDLVRWVRANSKDTECIILTGHEDFDTARAAVNCQCLGYILKPAEPKEVVTYLQMAKEKMMEKKRNRTINAYGKAYISQLEHGADASFGPGQMEQGSDASFGLRQMEYRADVTFGLSQPEQGPDAPFDLVDRVEHYIHAHISEKLSVEALASAFYISTAQLCRLFKKKLNMTVIDYIMHQRISLAKELLGDENLTITAVATRTGHNDYSYFTKIFKRITGMTPREYRKENNT